MLVKNFYNIVATIPQSHATNCGYLPVRNFNGDLWYVNNSYAQFPYTRTSAVSYAANTVGIAVGNGTTAVKETDYNLENTITSGINLNIASQVRGIDSDGSPYLKYLVVITNTGNSDITVGEIGYKQTVKVNELPGSYIGAVDSIVLIDRTLLDTPIAIEAGNAGVVEYTIKTVMAAPSIKAGVEIVDFTFGTDEQIIAMIDAARAGIIDLQTDGNWKIGDRRIIRIDSFVDGAYVTHAAQDVCIVISSFEEYEGCGNVLQFDFYNELATGIRMNPTNTNVGGYESSEMYTTSLPALVEALPTWLKSKLITFDVKVSAGNRSTTIVTVPNNKLALRSEYELYGAYSKSINGEPNEQVDLYKTGFRSKRRGISGSSTTYWERSPRSDNTSGFCSGDNSPYFYGNNANDAVGVAPFGCL